MRTALKIGLGALAGIGLLIMLALGTVSAIAWTEAGTRWALGLAQAQLNSPDLTLQWQVREGTLLSGLVLDDLRVESSAEDGAHIAVNIASIRFAWQPWRLLDGALVLNSVTVDGIDYQSDSGTTTSEPLTPDALRELLFGLPVSLELQALAAANISLRFDATTMVIDELAGSAVLDGDHLALEDLVVQQGDVRLAAELALQESLTVGGNLGWQLPIADVDYAGTLTLGGTLEQLELAHALTQPLAVQSNGTVVPGIFAGSAIDLDLLHRFEQLDLGVFGQPTIRLQQGEISTTGSPEALSIAGTLNPVIDGFEVLNLTFGLGYQPQEVSIDQVRLTSTQVDLAATGTLQLEPLALAVNWTLADLDVGDQLGNVQLSEVSGAGSVQLASMNQSLEIGLVLDNLQGLLNDYPLLIEGSAALTDAALTAIDLQAASQDNNLVVSGSAAPEQLNIDWQLQAPQLQQLWQGLQGQLAGAGTIRGSRELPELDGELTGQQLQLVSGDSTLLLDTLNLQASHANGENAIRLGLGALTLQGGPEGAHTQQALLERGALVLEGTPAQHQLSAELAAAEGDLALRVQGAAVDAGWQGELQSAGLQSIYGDWAMEEATALSWLDSNLNIAENCWRFDQTRLCMSAAQPAGAGIDADLAIVSLPLAWLNPSADAADRGSDFDPNRISTKPSGLQDLQDASGLNLPSTVRAAGTLDLQVAVRNLQGAQWDSLDASVQPADAVLRITQIPDSDIQTAIPLVQHFGILDTRINAQNSAGMWTGELAFGIARLEDSSRVMQGGFSGALTMDAAGELDGNADFNFDDLAWLETVVPTLRDPAGTLRGNARVRGNRDMPQLDARLQLQGGSFELPVYGLQIADVSVNVQSTTSAGSNTVVVDARANSGEGSLLLDARVDNALADARTFSATLSGTDFLAFNADYAVATISPDLRLDYTGNDVSVAGIITVPRMNLDLAGLLGDIGTNAVGVSRDVVIVKTAEGEDPQALQAQESLPLNVNVMLVLGDDVKLQGFGLDARLNGDLTLEQTPNRPLLVYGELGIPEGSYEIYNQRLNTRDGRVMFFGNPANPVVDIRAYRETRTAEVGMVLSGNINNMKGELYSTPTLPENEILALLVTGKSFNNVNDQDGDALLSAIANFGFERGQGLTDSVSSKLGLDSVTVGGGDTLNESALGLGKYLTPNLLMSYKVGLFDRQSILSIDYTLSERLKLEVETGISQSVEISYTIEKD